MDGVLVDSTPAVARVWRRWATKHGFEPELATKLAHGRPSLATVRDLLPNASAEVHLEEDVWLQQEEIADISDVVALPGALELLSTLSPKQFAVVTSATRRLAEVRLAAGGLLKYAQRLVTSADIECGKPDPEPYLKGASLLGLRAKDCVVIEDAPAGVRSGKAAGARVVGLRTTTADQEMLAAGADWMVNDCDALRIVSNAEGRIAFALAESMGERRVPRMS
jgi:sugar-phosphatase